MTISSQTVYIIAGPTASGKSRLALELAEQVGGEILNADSIQVYRDLRILTARPSVHDEARGPHHGYGTMDAFDTLSAGQWRDWAEAQIHQVQAKDRIAFVVGGTGLYLSSLLNGLVELPEIDPAIRTTLRARREAEGLQSLYAELLAKDPLTAQRLAPNDSQRILRALEVLLGTGKPLHKWQSQSVSSPRFQFKTILLLPDKAQLLERANARVIEMIKEGAVEEVQYLMDQHIPPTAPIFRALGAHAIYDYLRHMHSLETAIELTQIQTRQYIKRQYTWFRRQMTADTVLDSTASTFSISEV